MTSDRHDRIDSVSLVWSPGTCASVIRLAHDGCGLPPLVPEEAADALCIAALQSIDDGLFRHLWIIDCTQQAEERMQRILGSASARTLDRMTYASRPSGELRAWVRAVIEGNVVGPCAALPLMPDRVRRAIRRHDAKLCAYLSPGASCPLLAERCDRAVLRVLSECGIPTVTAGALRTFWDT
ncbi:MAG: hypothetical protein J0L58_10135 [Burkholderiales bacterium]|nr:hypothetical protein [Burkholderiales bacterium]